MVKNSNSNSLNNIRKRMHKTYSLIFTSYHEAGHVIYSLLHFIRVDSVLLYEYNRKTAGITHYDPIINIDYVHDQCLFNYLLNSEICMYYAGLVSEKIHYKNISGSDKFPNDLKSGSEFDTVHVSNLIKKYNLVKPGKKRSLFKKNLIKKISHILQKYWSDVCIIAHSLFEKKKLDFLDLKLNLITKSKNKQFWKLQFKTINKLFNFKSLDENKIKIILSI